MCIRDRIARGVVIGVGQRQVPLPDALDTAVQSLSRPGYQETAPSYAYQKIAALGGVEGIWQGHLSLADPDHNTARDQIANLEDTADCKGNWLRASVAPDGSFAITNGRNGFSKKYAAR